MRFPPGIPKQVLILALATGCSGTIGSTASSGGRSGSGGMHASGGTSGSGGTSSGSGGSGSGGDGSTAGSGGSGSGGSDGSGGAGYDPTLANCPTAVITPTPLRRLTKFEYSNTVKYLLGVDPSPANDLPADEVTDGFDNNAAVLTVSSLHAEKYVLVSEALAKAAVQNLSSLTTCDTVAKGEDACALDFARTFGRRAFRRPTTANDETMLMAAYGAGRTGGSYGEGIEVMIRAALQSTDFLYRLELTSPSNSNAQLVPLSGFERATRLSYLIWSAGPDDALLDAAARGDLDSKDGVASKARAMLQDPKARPAITDFYDQWAGTSRLDIMTKSADQFPAYSDAVRDAMKLELPAFVSYVLWDGGDRSLNTLLTSQQAFVNSSLASIYGVPAPSGSDAGTLKMVTLPSSQGRAGILTQAGFLAVQAHPDQTSPVLRGKFVRSRLMCQPPPPPPADANIIPPAITSANTARERSAGHVMAGSSCSGCHQLMDPIGLTFENFDAVGSYRQTENGETIDVSGMIVGASDPNLSGAFNGVRELAGKLASSAQVRDCMATNWFRFASGRSEDTPDGCSLTTLQGAFASSGGDLVELIVASTQTDAFWYRAPFTQ
ncbi:MAG TPA: DUF1592 domain-containing protein [Polyangia bacterium]|jgi:hypothetical protein